MQPPSSNSSAPPLPVRANADNVDQLFERVLLDIQGSGNVEPGYRCRLCGWTYAGLGLPPSHLCTPAPKVMERRVAVVMLPLSTIVSLLQSTAVSTFKVTANPLPPDAHIVGAVIDPATGVLQIAFESASLPLTGERGPLPLVWPDVTLTGVTVIATEAISPEEPLIETERSSLIETEEIDDA